jgi:catechol 2,3-dioxygenase-like lactoylglutathione lyase family enzyme
VKQRTRDPSKPADRYGRELPAFTVNLIVRDVPRAVGFQTEVLGAKVHYADPDFAALNVGGVEDPDGYLWAVGVPTPPKPGS